VLVDWLGNLFRLPMTALVVWLTPGEPLAQVARRSWRPALLIGAISPVSYVLVLYAATLAPLSRVAPARELSMLFAAAASGRLLGERDTGLRLLGAALTAGGVMALAWAG
jgi:drug/metabolite transporter (DMT)-like permease